MEIKNFYSLNTGGVTTPPTYNLLMIGNSFCDYFGKDLNGIAKSLGINLNVYNVYKSGCTINEHHHSILNGTLPGSEDSYVIHYNGNKSSSLLTTKDLKDCLSFNNIKWDFITLQEHFGIRQLPGNSQFPSFRTELHKVKYIYDYIKDNFPKAKLFWHETWAYDIGHYQGPTNLQGQLEDQEYIRWISMKVCKDNDVTLIPCGDIWERMRAIIKTSLCQNSTLRNYTLPDTLQTEKRYNDYYHDGDVGGGNILNALTFAQVILNRNIQTSSYRPDYYLDDTFIKNIKKLILEVINKYNCIL